MSPGAGAAGGAPLPYRVPEQRFASSIPVATDHSHTPSVTAKRRRRRRRVGGDGGPEAGGAGRRRTYSGGRAGGGGAGGGRLRPRPRRGCGPGSTPPSGTPTWDLGRGGSPWGSYSWLRRWLRPPWWVSCTWPWPSCPNRPRRRRRRPSATGPAVPPPTGPSAP